MKTRGTLVCSSALVGVFALAVAPGAQAVINNGNGQILIQTEDSGFDAGTFNLGVNTSAGTYGIMYDYPDDPWSSVATLRVDGQDTSLRGGDVSVTAFNGGSKSVMTVDGIQVTQTVTPYNNPATGRVDSALISYTMKNTSSATHSVGIRSLIDTLVNDNDYAPFRVPGVGPVTTEQSWSGNQVPSSFLVFYDLEDSQHVAEARFSGAGLTKPNAVKAVRWTTAKSSQWDYATTPGKDMGDSAFLAYYNPTSLAPGQSRTVSFAYGAGSATASVSASINAGLAGPTELSVADNNYTPNPFDVVATLENPSEAALHGVKVTLQLPEGLSTSAPLSYTVGDMAAGANDVQHSWSVTAAPSGVAKTLTYKVVVHADGLPDRVLTRTVKVPAITGAPVTNPTTPTNPTSPTQPTSPTAPTTPAPTSTAPVTGPKVDTDYVGSGSATNPTNLALALSASGILAGSGLVGLRVARARRDK